MTEKDFNDCLRQIGEGYSSAFEPIFTEYYSKLIHSVEMEVQDKEVAEDIVSNAFLTILKNAKGYGVVKSPNAWIYKVVRNETVNYKRKNNKYVFVDRSVMDEVVAANHNDSDFSIELKSAVGKLTLQQQKIFELHYMLGWLYKEIAKELNISVSTIKREIKVIKKSLQYLVNM